MLIVPASIPLALMPNHGHHGDQLEGDSEVELGLEHFIEETYSTARIN